MRSVRRSQLISPWGIGAMVDFPNDESLMTCGLDAWPFSDEECPPDFKIVEERLQARLRVDHFRLPPDFRIPGPGVQHPGRRFPFVRFPRWHYCPRCGSMQELSPFGGSQRCNGPNYADGLSCYSLPETKRPRLIPMRFVAVCEQRGHIQDFPFMEWVHRDQPPAPDCRLRARAGRSAAGLSGFIIHCLCGQSRTMAGAFSDDALQNIGVLCGGQRPWLGETVCSITRCGQRLQVIQRGASNVYFPHVLSSIYLPLWGERATRRVVELLEDPEIWSFLTSGLVDGRIDLQRCVILSETPGKCMGINPEELAEAAQRRLDDAGSIQIEAEESEEEYRHAEYEALKSGRGGDQTDLFARRKEPDEYGIPVRDFFSTITLVYKLRETRAFCGFSRYLPDDTRSRSEKITDLSLNPHINWLPAIVVRGEGIFLELKTDFVEWWMNNSSVIARADELADNYNRLRVDRGQPARRISPRFILLHTLAHLLINQLSFECGYGSSSLRERIYCNTEDETRPMNGFLIYTASGDSEGTMGGLVKQGTPGNLERTLVRALRKAMWCSYDPICMESSGQGPDSCNLAACHGCSLLPETSCEEGNRLLDRAMVVGFPDQPEIGLFGEFINGSSL